MRRYLNLLSTPQAAQDLKSIEYEWSFPPSQCWITADWSTVIIFFCRESAQTLLNFQTAPLAMSTDQPHVHQAFVQYPAGLGYRPSFPLRKLTPPFLFRLWYISFIVSDNVRLLTNHLGVLDSERGCSKRYVEAHQVNAELVSNWHCIRAIFVLDTLRFIKYSKVLRDNEPFPMETILSKVRFSIFPYSRCDGKIGFQGYLDSNYLKPSNTYQVRPETYE